MRQSQLSKRWEHAQGIVAIIPTCFKPWRRKLGVMTLALACVFAAGWVRSLLLTDSAGWHLGAELVTFSHDGHLSAYVRTKHSVFRWAWPRFYTDGYRRFTDPGDKQNWQWTFAGVRFGSKNADEPYFHIVAVPYSYIVLPLTLLSASLLLSKPRNKPTATN